jgi:hypothetical protein
VASQAAQIRRLQEDLQAARQASKSSRRNSGNDTPGMRLLEVLGGDMDMQLTFRHVEAQLQQALRCQRAMVWVVEDAGQEVNGPHEHLAMPYLQMARGIWSLLNQNCAHLFLETDSIALCPSCGRRHWAKDPRRT